MGRTAIEVDGARQLRASLKRAGLDVQDLKDAHRAVAEMVKDRAAPAAPRRTGRLAGSLRAAGTQREAIVRAGGARVPYANPIHWGWPARHIAAQRFISDAVLRNEDPALDMYLHALETIIDKIEGTHTP